MIVLQMLVRWSWMFYLVPANVTFCRFCLQLELGYPFSIRTIYSETMVEELRCALFDPLPREKRQSGASQGRENESESMVDKLLVVGLHLARLCRDRGGGPAASVAGQSSASVPRPPEPTGARRRKGSQRGGYPMAEDIPGGQSDPSEASLALDYMASFLNCFKGGCIRHTRVHAS